MSNLITEARELIEALHAGEYDDEYIGTGAYLMLDELCDALYTWTERKNGIEYETLICGECLMEHLREMSINEVAELIGSRKVVVE